MVQSYAKAWIGTSFQDSFAPPKDAVEYAVYQRERCPKTEKLHWQWMVVFNSRHRLQGVKKLLGECHAEVCRSLRSSRQYCMKTESRVTEPVEIGVFAGEAAAVAAVLKRVRPLQLLEERPSLWRSWRALQDIRSAVMPKRTDETSAFLFFGDSGVGKSTIARRIADFVGEEEVFWQDNSQWWDGYQQQGLVVIDEFRGQMPVQQLLRLIDRNPYRVPVKGSTVEFASKVVILTSNLSLDAMYQGLDWATLLAVKRRIHTVYFKK